MTHLIVLLGDSGAVSIVVKATVIAALGLIGAWLGRGSRAAVRHAVLAACFAALLGLPVASFLIPPVHVAVAQAPIVSSRFAEAIDATLPVVPMKVSAPSVARWSVPPFGNLLFTGWIVGAVFFLLRIIVGLRQVRVLRRFGLPWREGQVAVERMAVEAGVRRHVEILLYESLPAPVTCGAVRPAIVLPPDARNWDGEDLNRAIVHELEHVRRWDWVGQCFARVVCAVYWFHPLVWIAWRQFSLEAERACDDAVLRRSEATAYADQLVVLAQRLSNSAGGKSPALAMANRSDLSSRVGHVLDSGRRRGRAGVVPVTVACGVAAAVVLSISPLRMVAAPQSAPAQSAANALAFEVVSVKRDKTGGPPSLRYSPAGIDFVNVPLSWIIGEAYQAPYARISSSDPHINDLFFSPAGTAYFYDIAARAGSAVPKEEIRLMLQSLLGNRFKLTLHHESKVVPVYKLVVGKNGPKLHESAAEGEPSGAVGMNGFVCSNVEMARFASMLSVRMDRPVVDLTGLKGTYDFTLKSSFPAEAGKAALSEWFSSSIFTDIQMQLGLQLETDKAPVDSLVIDSVEQPSEN